MRTFNFSAGPAVLPESVLQRAADEMLDWHGSGMSVMEMSHRSKMYTDIYDRAVADLRELMDIPEDYEVLFLQGGATTHFALLPMNLAAAGQRADYLVTGAWSKKAAAEGKEQQDESVLKEKIKEIEAEFKRLKKERGTEKHTLKRERPTEKIEEAIEKLDDKIKTFKLQMEDREAGKEVALGTR